MANITSSSSAPIPNWKDGQAILREIMKHPTPEMEAMFDQIPAMNPPPGIDSNLENPSTIRNLQITVLTILLFIMTLFLANRAYVKLWLMKQFRWDDATLCVGVIATLICYGTATWGVVNGPMGSHLWDVSLLDALGRNFMLPNYIITVVTSVAFGFVKSTFFILYLQLFYQMYWVRIVSIIGLCGNISAYIAITTAQIYYFTPRPDERRGDFFLTHDPDALTRVLIPFSIILLLGDIVILVIPIVAVSMLRAPLKKKLGAMLIFLSGIMACVCSSLSFYYRMQLDAEGDVTYRLVYVCITSQAELMIGIICACMPSVAYTYRHVEALQGIRRRITSFLSCSALRTRTVAISTIKIDTKAGNSSPHKSAKSGKSVDSYMELTDTFPWSGQLPADRSRTEIGSAV